MSELGYDPLVRPDLQRDCLLAVKSRSLQSKASQALAEPREDTGQRDFADQAEERAGEIGAEDSSLIRHTLILELLKMCSLE